MAREERGNDFGRIDRFPCERQLIDIADIEIAFLQHHQHPTAAQVAHGGPQGKIEPAIQWPTKCGERHLGREDQE